MTITQRYIKGLPFIIGSFSAIPISMLLFDGEPKGAILFSFIMVIIPLLKYIWESI